MIPHSLQSELIQKIREMKRVYDPEGLVLLAIYGSFARGDQNENSDIDILFRYNEIAEAKYIGWNIFGLYDRVKCELETEFQRKVDLTDIDAMSKIGSKYILVDALYVE